MRDQDRDPAVRRDVGARDFREPLEQRVLGLGIQRRGRLVEHEQEWLLAHEAAGERELLPLPEAHVYPVVPGRPELGVEPGREPVDHVTRTGAPDRTLDRRPFVDVGMVAHADTRLRKQFEPVEVLEGAREMGAPLVGRHAREVDAVNGDSPTRRRVHVGEELHERALARAVLADQRDHRTRRQLDVHVGEGLAIGPRVGERHVLEADAVVDPFGHRDFRGAGLARGVVLEPGQAP